MTVTPNEVKGRLSLRGPALRAVAEAGVWGEEYVPEPLVVGRASTYALGSLLVAFVPLCACSERPDLLNGAAEIQYRIDSVDHRPGENVFFVFTDNGEWSAYEPNDRDSLVRSAYYDRIVEDRTYNYDGKGIYFWGYQWDVLDHDEQHLEVRQVGGGEQLYMVRTNYPFSKR